MKALTVRELNRRTAAVLDAVERGESFELRRNGKAVGFLTRAAPRPEGKPDWRSHFEWLRGRPKSRGARLMAEFEEERRRLRESQEVLERMR